MFLSFFFQAEDGIRDHCVTGVQTCALPILLDEEWAEFYSILLQTWKRQQFASWQSEEEVQHILLRSEERRVGKECRCRRWPYHKKIKRRRTIVYDVENKLRGAGIRRPNGVG